MELTLSTMQHWRHVLLTDESSFCLDVTDRCARVWRRQSERLYAANIAENDRYGGRSVLVRGGISLNGRTDLVVINRGTLTGHQYIDDTLDNQVRLYAGAHGGQFILMDNNSGPHRTNTT
jgi:hypothetical protein